MTTDERREHARIETGLACSVAAAESAFDARVVNLSKGGVAFEAAKGSAKIDEPVTLLIEREQGLISIALSARVVRIDEKDALAVFGCEFEALPPEAEEQLTELLESVAGGKGQGSRAHPRVATRIGVTCRTHEGFSATLNDLSKGGLSVRTPRAIAQGETMAVHFGLQGTKGLIEVKGTVLHCAPEPDGHFRVGMKFTPPSEAARQQVKDLLDTLLGLGVGKPKQPK